MAVQKNSHAEHLYIALLAATEAGDYFRTRIDNVGEVKTKSSPSDLVTDVDPECERRIRQHIHSQFPNHAILGEETTSPGAAASAEAARKVAAEPNLWIIDPLDGTTNFVHGMPLSVVSLAYAEDGDVKVGVIYDPYRRELFYAVRGLGAYRIRSSDSYEWARTAADQFQGERLHVSEEAVLRKCIVATGLPTRGEHREWTTEAALRLVRKIKSFRILGAAALHLAYVASGRIDAFWEYDLNAWDLAAGVLLVEEAGGVTREIGGATYHLEVRDILAGGREDILRGIEDAVRVPTES